MAATLLRAHYGYALIFTGQLPHLFWRLKGGPRGAAMRVCPQGVTRVNMTSCSSPGSDLRMGMAARDFDRAANPMELAAPAVRPNRQGPVIIDRLKALPDDTVGRSPVLSVFYRYMFMVSGGSLSRPHRVSCRD